MDVEPRILSSHRVGPFGLDRFQTRFGAIVWIVYTPDPKTGHGGIFQGDRAGAVRALRRELGRDDSRSGFTVSAATLVAYSERVCEACGETLDLEAFDGGNGDCHDCEADMIREEEQRERDLAFLSRFDYD